MFSLISAVFALLSLIVSFVISILGLSPEYIKNRNSYKNTFIIFSVIGLFSAIIAYYSEHLETEKANEDLQELKKVNQDILKSNNTISKSNNRIEELSNATLRSNYRLENENVELKAKLDSLNYYSLQYTAPTKNIQNNTIRNLKKLIQKYPQYPTIYLNGNDVPLAATVCYDILNDLNLSHIRAQVIKGMGMGNNNPKPDKLLIFCQVKYFSFCKDLFKSLSPHIKTDISFVKPEYDTNIDYNNSIMIRIIGIPIFDKKGAVILQ